MIKLKRKISGIVMAIFMGIHGLAQTQQGIVKTIGRPNKPGIVLGNVVLSRPLKRLLSTSIQ